MPERSPDRRLADRGTLGMLVGATAILAVAAMLLYLYARLGQGPEAMAPALEEETAPRLAKREPVRPPGAGRTLEDFEDDVRALLARDRLPTRPLPGPLRFTAREIHWQDPAGRPFLTAPVLSGLLAPDPLLQGRVVAGDMVLESPRLLLVQVREGGPFNYEGIFAGGEEPAPFPPPPGALAILRDSRVRAGRVEIRGPEATYVMTDLDARLTRIELPARDPAAADLRIAGLTARVDAPGWEGLLPVALADARVRVADDRFPFRIGRLEIPGATFEDAIGDWRPAAGGFGLTVRDVRSRIRFAEARDHFPALPESGTATFDLDMDPLPGDRTRLRLQGLRLVADATDIRGDVTFVYQADRLPRLEDADLSIEPLDLAFVQPYVDPLPFGGTLRGRVVGPAGALRYDVTARLTAPEWPEPVEATLAGTASLGPEGPLLRSLEAEFVDVPLALVRTMIPALPVDGRISGRVSVEGSPEDVPLRVDLRVESAGGVALLEGSVDLRQDRVAYDLSGRLAAFPIDAVLRPEVPPVTFTGSFFARGRGSTPEDAEASFRIEGGFSGWETQPGDSLLFAGRLDRGILVIDAFSAAVGPVHASASGELRVISPERGTLSYVLDVRDLAPIAPFVPFLIVGQTEGSVRLEGQLAGTLAEPRPSGTVQASGFRVGEWAVGGMGGRYRAVFGPEIPEIDVIMQAEAISTADAGTFSEAELRLQVNPPAFQGTLLAQGEDGARIELETRGRIVPGEGEATVERLVMDLRDQRWALARPADVRWGGIEGAVVDSLLVRHETGPGWILVDGRVPVDAPADLHVQAVALPIGDLVALAGMHRELTGGLWADLRLGGTRSAPRVEGSVTLLGGELRDIPYGRLEGEVRYEAGALQVDGLLALAAAEGEATARVTLPLDFTLAPFAFGFRDEGAISGQVLARDLSLRPLAGLTAQLQETAGRITGDVRFGGTWGDPLLEGSLSLREGSARVPMLNRTFEEAAGSIVFDRRAIVIHEIRARSDGTAVATGRIELPAGQSPALAVDVQLDRFRPIAFQRMRPVATWGVVRVRGTTSLPVLRGRIRVEDGSLSLPAAGAPRVLEERFLDDPGGPLGVEAFPGLEPAPAAATFFLDDVAVEFGNDVWFVAEDTRAQLSGDLVVTGGGEQLQVVGDLAGTQGSFTLRAGPVIRRFTIVNARIRFFGNPVPNPAIDITASRVVPLPDGGRLDVQVRVSGTLDRPTLSLATAEGQTVPEGQLLSFLLFGQPGIALAGLSGEGLVEGAFLGGLGDFAAMELEQAFVREMGVPLDIFQIRIGAGGPLGLGAPTVLMGKELTDDLLLTVDAGLGTLLGGEQAAGGIWAIILEWRIDQEWSLDVGIEPVNRARLLRQIGPLTSLIRPRQEFIVELRRRWTY